MRDQNVLIYHEIQQPGTMQPGETRGCWLRARWVLRTRNHGDYFWFCDPFCPTHPFSFSKYRRTVLEVEVMSHQDRKSWFVFEVELDGETKISQSEVTLVFKTANRISIFGWLYKVADAANKILTLPAVSSLEYSTVWMSLRRWFFQNLCCTESNWLRIQLPRTRGPSSQEDRTKHSVNTNDRE